MSWFGSDSEWKQNLGSVALTKVAELEDQVEKLKKDRSQKQNQLDTTQQSLEKQKKKVEEELKSKQSLMKEVEHLEQTCQMLQDKHRDFGGSSNSKHEEMLRQQIDELKSTNKMLEEKCNQRTPNKDLLKVPEKSTESSDDFWSHFSTSAPKPVQSPNKAAVIKKALETSEENPFKAPLKTPQKKGFLTPFKTPNKYASASCLPGLIQETDGRKELEAQLLQCQTELTDLRKAKNDNSPGDIASLQSELQTVKSNEKILADQLASSKSRCEELETNLNQQSQKLTSLQNEFDCQRHNSETAKQHLERKYKEKQRELQDEINRTTSNLVQLENTLKEQETKLAQQESQALSAQNVLQAAYDKLLSQQSSTEAEKNSLSREMNSLQNELLKLQKSEDDLKKTVGQLTVSKQLAVSEFENLKLKNTECENNCSKLEIKISQYEEQILDKEKQIEKIDVQCQDYKKKLDENRMAYEMEVNEKNKVMEAHAKLTTELSLKDQHLQEALVNCQQKEDFALKIESECNEKLKDMEQRESQMEMLTSQIEQMKQNHEKTIQEMEGALLSEKSQVEKLTELLAKSTEDLKLKAQEEVTITEMKAQIELLERNVGEMEQLRKEIDQQKSHNESLKSQLEKQQSDFTEEKLKLQSQIQQLHDTEASQLQQSQQLQQTAEEYTRKLQEFELNHERLICEKSNENAELRTKLMKLESSIEDSVKEFELYQSSVGEKIREVRLMESESWKNEITLQQTAVEKYENTMNDFMTKLTMLTNLSDLKGEVLKDTEILSHTSSDTLAKISELIEILIKQFNLLNTAKCTQEDRIKKLQDELSEKRVDYENLSENFTKINEEKVDLEQKCLTIDSLVKQLNDSEKEVKGQQQTIQELTHKTQQSNESKKLVSELTSKLDLQNTEKEIIRNLLSEKMAHLNDASNSIQMTVETRLSEITVRMDTTIKTLQTQLQLERSQCSDSEGKYNTLKTEYDSTQKIIQDLNYDLLSKSNEISNLNELLTSHLVQIEGLNDSVKSLKDQLSEKCLQSVSLDEMVAARQEIEDLKTNLEAQNLQVIQQAEKLQNSESRLQELLDVIEKHKNKMDDVIDEAEYKANIDKLESEKAELNERDQYQMKLSEMLEFEQKYNELYGVHVDMEKLVQSLEANLEKAEFYTAEVRQELDAKIESLTNRLSEMETTNEGITMEKNLLEDEKSKLHDHCEKVESCLEAANVKFTGLSVEFESYREIIGMLSQSSCSSMKTNEELESQISALESTNAELSKAYANTLKQSVDLAQSRSQIATLLEQRKIFEKEMQFIQKGLVECLKEISQQIGIKCEFGVEDIGGADSMTSSMELTSSLFVTCEKQLLAIGNRAMDLLSRSEEYDAMATKFNELEGLTTSIKEVLQISSNDDSFSLVNKLMLDYRSKVSDINQLEEKLSSSQQTTEECKTKSELSVNQYNDLLQTHCELTEKVKLLEKSLCEISDKCKAENCDLDSLFIVFADTKKMVEDKDTIVSTLKETIIKHEQRVDELQAELISKEKQIEGTQAVIDDLSNSQQSVTEKDEENQKQKEALKNQLESIKIELDSEKTQTKALHLAVDSHQTKLNSLVTILDDIKSELVESDETFDPSDLNYSQILQSVKLMVSSYRNVKDEYSKLEQTHAQTEETIKLLKEEQEKVKLLENSLCEISDKCKVENCDLDSLFIVFADTKKMVEDKDTIISTLKETIIKHEQRVDEIQAELISKEKQLEHTQAVIDDLSNSQESAIQKDEENEKQKEALKTQLDSEKTQTKALHIAVDSHQTKLNSLVAILDDIKSELVEFDETSDPSGRNYSQILQSVKLLTTQYRNVKDEYSKLEQTHAQTEDTIKLLQEEQEKVKLLENSLSEISDKCKAENCDLDSLFIVFADTKKMVEDKETDITTLKEIIKKHEQRVDELQAELISKEKELEHTQAVIDDLSNSQQSYIEKAGENQKQKEALENQLESIKIELDSEKTQTKALHIAVDSHQTKLNSLIAILDDIKSELVEFDETFDPSGLNYAQILQSVKLLTTRYTNSEDKYSKLEQTHAQTEETIKLLQDQYEKSVCEHDSTQKTVCSLTKTVGILTKQIEESQKTISDLKESQASLNLRKSELEENISKLQKQYSDLKSELSDKECLLVETKKSVGNLEESLTKLSEEKSQLEGTFNKLLIEKQSLEEKLIEKEGSNDKMQELELLLIKYKEDIRVANQTTEEKTKKIEELQGVFEETEKTMASLGSKLKLSCRNLVKKEAEVQKCNKLITKLNVNNKQLKETNRELDEMKIQLKLMQESKINAEEQLKAKLENFEITTKELENAQKKCKQLESSQKDLKSKCTQLQGQIKKLTMGSSKLRGSQSSTSESEIGPTPVCSNILGSLPKRKDHLQFLNDLDEENTTRFPIVEVRRISETKRKISESSKVPLQESNSNSPGSPACKRAKGSRSSQRLSLTKR